MSRTYRKHAKSFNVYYELWLDKIESGLSEVWQIEYISKEKYRYTVRGGRYYDFTLPHWYRNIVNRIRRRKDKRELWLSVNMVDHEEQCSTWNCKDSKAWGYW